MNRVHEGLLWPGVTRDGLRLRGGSRRAVRTLAGLAAVLIESLEAAHNRLLRVRGRSQGVPDLAELTRQEETELVRRLFLRPEAANRRTVLFAGVELDNGSEAICARAARGLAELQSGSVCVVDADLRSPLQCEEMGRHTLHGLATAVGLAAAATAFVRQVSPENLWLLPAGSSASDPEALLTAPRVKPRLQELCARFDRVLISAPPIDLHAESLALGQMVDGVVLVVAANVTRRNAVHRVKSRLDALGVPVLGIVLNERTFPIPEPLYRLSNRVAPH